MASENTESVLGNLEPARVFYYFEQICGIPHGSGNISQISSWICAQAEKMDLRYVQDEIGNVIIYKPASPGYENEPAVILQGHMDMVAVSDPGVDTDMKRDGLRLKTDGLCIYAEGTSLGGDDGIAVAYALAILENDGLRHPALEVVITVDEETGMEGAGSLDGSLISGRRLLNLDNEEEGVILAGCAGGARVYVDIPVEREAAANPAQRYTVSISGCRGGHSGQEIDKGRINPIMAEGRLLFEMRKACAADGAETEIRFVSLDGGAADNAIPTGADMVVELAGDIQNVHNMTDVIFAKLASEIKEEYKTTEPEMKITIEKTEDARGSLQRAAEQSTAVTAAVLMTLPNGIQAMSADVPGLVETSLNLGVAATDERRLTVQFAVRSSVESAKTALIDRIKAAAELGGCITRVAGIYPGWKFRKDSPFRDKMVSIYREMYGTEPEVVAIHAGLECGFFAEKLPGLDSVSIGPDMSDIHTTSEKLSIASVQNTWDYVCRVLETRD